MASCAVDMRGIGECSINASPAADKIFSAVIDYWKTVPMWIPSPSPFMGRSFGGYRATTMAHVGTQRLRASLFWGGEFLNN